MNTNSDKVYIKRSRHGLAKPKRSPEEIKQLMAWRQQNLPKTLQEMEKAEEQARAVRDGLEPPALSDIRPEVPAFDPRQGMPIPLSTPVRPGCDRDLEAWRLREEEIPTRETGKVGLEFRVSEEARQTFERLLNRSQPRRPGQGEIGWRYVSLSEYGANPLAVLGLEPPEPPYSGWTVINPPPEISAELRLEAAQRLSRDIPILKEAGALRDCGFLLEIRIPRQN